MLKSNYELLLTLILSSIATIFKQYGLLWFLVICTLAMESVTYYIAAHAKNRKIQTNKRRFLKVMSQIISLFFGMLLDSLENYLITNSGQVLGITLTISIPFGVIICVYIILSESIDILNNLNAAGARFPPIVMRFLKTLKEKISENEVTFIEEESYKEPIALTETKKDKGDVK